MPKAASAGLASVIAASYRNDAAFIREWQSYERANRRAIDAMPLYDDGVYRVYRKAARKLAHLTYSIPEERAPVLLCLRTYRNGTTWFGWRTPVERERVATLQVCTSCRRAYADGYLS